MDKKKKEAPAYPLHEEMYKKIVEVIYEIRFSGLWLGGKAIVRAIDAETAWTMVQKEWPSLEPLDKCEVKKLSEEDGILYFDSGDY